MQNQYFNRRPPIDILNTQKAERSKLTALEYIKETVPFGKSRRTAIICQCDCGNKLTISVFHFKNGGIRSCGCMPKGEARTYQYSCEKIRNIYYAMISRCHIPTDTGYKYYGGRGVKVCDEWRNNPQLFFDWAVENGWEPGLELDKDKIGDGLLYSPQTCCFLTNLENMRHKRNSVKTEYMGKDICISELREIIGCSHTYIKSRLDNGKSAEDIEKEYNESTDVRLNKFKVANLKN